MASTGFNLPTGEPAVMATVTAVSEEFLMHTSDDPPMAAYTATVTVRLKQGVLDPEAETTKNALERLGFDVEGLRFADQFEIDIDAESQDDAHDRAESMAERLLANPTIHDYEVVVDER